MSGYLLAGLLLLSASTFETETWTHVAGDTQHTGSAARGPSNLDHLRWNVTLDPNRAFVDQSSPVVYNGRVFVAARRFQGFTQTGNQLIAFSVVDGAELWATDLPSDTLDSWSSAAVDVHGNQVLIASNDRVYAIRAGDGQILWDTKLRRSAVNASPVVTADLQVGGVAANRVVLTDFDGVGTQASLYCINVSKKVVPHNPYDLGEIVWRLPIGTASGATPAYDDGIAYLASGAGNMVAVDVLNPPLDPNDPNQPLPVWQTTIASARTANEGFYGGVALVDGQLLAGQYEFVGGANSARLFAVDAASGGKLWETACERTSSIPLVNDGEVLLAAGIVGFGSEPKLQAFVPDANSAVLTWEATGGNSVAVGGYTHHPSRVGDLVYTGTPPTGLFFGPHTDLFIVDSKRDPNDPAFVVDQFTGAGGSPALAYGRLFSIGEQGLHAFDPSPQCAADGDASGTVDLSDLAKLLSAFGAVRGDASFSVSADVDLNNAVDLADLAALLAVFGENCP